MLKDTFFNRVFIRGSIILLRAVAPLSIAYCSARILVAAVKADAIRVPKALLVAVDVFAASEALFYFLVYLPRKWYFNRAAPPFTPFKTREERSQAFDKVWGAVPDPKSYVSGWFKWVPVEELRREDVKDWLSWRVWNKTKRDEEDEEELEDYLARTEEIACVKFPEGRSGNDSMMVTFEPLGMRHRPLLWYVCFIGGADLAMSTLMTFYGYYFYTLPLHRFFSSSLPLRPYALLSRRRSPSPQLSYWHLPHKSSSSSHLPVVFIHGIGVGIHFYLSFMQEFKQQLHDKHGIGIAAFEVMPIASRVTSPILQSSEFAAEFRRILKHHGWTRCVLATHSYGSVLAAHLLRSPETSSMIGDLLFVDPVTFSFHPPQVPWNFLRRRPESASEWQLWYFASMDPDVARVLTRSFVWTENSLWREDIGKRAAENDPTGRRKWRTTVTISGQDIITDTDTLGKYLTRKPEGRWYEQTRRGTVSESDEWKRRKWTGEDALEVVWFPDSNHAEAFDGKEERQLLLDVVKKYSMDDHVADNQANGSATVNESTPLLDGGEGRD